MENETRFYRSERRAAILISILYPAYVNKKLEKGLHTTNNFSLTEAGVHFKHVEPSKDCCGLIPKKGRMSKSAKCTVTKV